MFAYREPLSVSTRGRPSCGPNFCNRRDVARMVSCTSSSSPKNSLANSSAISTVQLIAIICIDRHMLSTALPYEWRSNDQTRAHSHGVAIWAPALRCASRRCRSRRRPVQVVRPAGAIAVVRRMIRKAVVAQAHSGYLHGGWRAMTRDARQGWAGFGNMSIDCGGCNSL